MEAYEQVLPGLTGRLDEMLEVIERAEASPNHGVGYTMATLTLGTGIMRDILARYKEEKGGWNPFIPPKD